MHKTGAKEKSDKIFLIETVNADNGVLLASFLMKSREVLVIFIRHLFCAKVSLFSLVSFSGSILTTRKPTVCPPKEATRWENQGQDIDHLPVAAKIYPTEVRATGVGRFGAVVGPYVGGLFIAGGMSMETNFVLFSIPLVVSGILACTLAVR